MIAKFKGKKIKHTTSFLWLGAQGQGLSAASECVLNTLIGLDEFYFPIQ